MPSCCTTGFLSISFDGHCEHLQSWLTESILLIISIIKPSSYALVQVSSAPCSDIALNNTELGNLRHLSVFAF